MQNPFLVGAKVYLRPLELADAPVMQAWVNDQEVIRNLLLYRPVNLQNEEDFVRRSAEGKELLSLGIVAKRTDRLIGTTGLFAIDWKNRQAGFGIEIGAKREWGKGYGTEATRLIVGYGFDTLNLNRVWLEVHEDNVRGRRAYERVGFRREGLMRQRVFREGRYWDTIFMALLREEWERARPKKRRR